MFVTLHRVRLLTFLNFISELDQKSPKELYLIFGFHIIQKNRFGGFAPHEYMMRKCSLCSLMFDRFTEKRSIKDGGESHETTPMH